MELNQRVAVQVIAITCIVVLFSLPLQTEGCDLAWHDWQVRLKAVYRLSEPVLPLAEISYLNSKYDSGIFNQILWHYSLTAPFNIVHNFSRMLVGGWVSKIDWIIATDIEQIKRDLSMATVKKKPMLMVSNKNTELAVLILSDVNSGLRCHQIVLVQRSLARVASTGQHGLTAKEFVSRAWISMVFYLTPQNLISLSVFPVEQKQKDIYTNEILVKSLIEQNFLKKRPEIFVNPYDFGFPEPADLFSGDI